MHWKHEEVRIGQLLKDHGKQIFENQKRVDIHKKILSQLSFIQFESPDIQKP